MKILSIPSDEKLSRIIGIIVFGFKIIGLAPFSLQRTKTPGGVSRNPADHCTSVFLFSKMGMVYNILLLSLFIVMGVIAIPQLVLIQYRNKSSVTQTIDVTQGILRTLTSCIIIFYWTLRQETAASIMNRLSEANSLLSGIKKHPPRPGMLLKFLAIHIIPNLFLWGIFWASLNVSSISFSSWFIRDVPPFVINWFVIEYSILIGVLAKQFGSLNKNLMDSKQFPNSSFRTPLLNDCQLTVVQIVTTFNQLPSLQLLHTIRTKLDEVSSDIAEFFSLPILPCIACIFLTLVCNIFYLVIPVVVSVDVLDLTLTDNINILVWICISFYPLILLAINVKETLKEAELTGLIIHKLLAETKRREIESEIFGATATYLVIIIQFMMPANHT